MLLSKTKELYSIYLVAYEEICYSNIVRKSSPPRQVCCNKKPEITFTFSGHLISSQNYWSFLLNACWSWKCKQAWNWSCFCVVPILGKQSHTASTAQYFSPACLVWNSLVCKAKMKQFSSLILIELIESKIIKSLCKKNNQETISHYQHF